MPAPPVTARSAIFFLQFVRMLPSPCRGRGFVSTVVLVLLVMLVSPVQAGQDVSERSAPPVEPRPAPQPASASGILKVTSSVPGASVYLDGELAGSAPVTRYLSPGSHLIRVVLDFYDPFVRRVDIAADTTIRLDALLSPGKGTVEFASQLPGTRVTLDERDLGPAPIRVHEMKPGEHSYRFTAPLHEDATGTFTFKTGQNLLIAPTLESSEGKFVVESDPPGATVLLDGKNVGVTPWHGTGIPSGGHEVRLDRSGMATVFRFIDTSDGSRGELYSHLSRKGAHLRVKSPSAEAQLSLNGVLVGTGRKVRIPRLDRGSYSARVEAPGYAPAERMVEVPNRGRVLLQAKLIPASLGTESQIVTQKPLLERWIFWAATGTVAAGAVTGAVILATTHAPAPPPEGDVQVVLP
jgi:hypothetical protein